jgi:hypothetical protein
MSRATAWHCPRLDRASVLTDVSAGAVKKPLKECPKPSEAPRRLRPLDPRRAFVAVMLAGVRWVCDRENSPYPAISDLVGRNEELGECDRRL